MPGSLTPERIRSIAEHYVASRECSRAMLRDVLVRRLDRRLYGVPEDEAGPERALSMEAIEAEIDRLVAAGVIDDARYAEMKARSAFARGLATRRILQDLARKGIAEETAEDALAAARREITGTCGRELADDDVAEAAEWEAAETFARKKRIGPWRAVDMPEDHAGRRKLWAREAGKMARAGFDVDVIRQVLDREPEED